MTSLRLRNARIWTGDAAQPWAGCALIERGRFVFVGSDRGVTPPANAETLDAGGRLVLPGFTDAHIHLRGTGEAMRSVDLKGVESEEGAARLVGERAAVTPKDAWVQGAGWDQHLWPGARFPTRRSLDAVAPEHPVLLVHTSGHCIWVNSAALRLASVTAVTEAPSGGGIDLGDDGEPSGVLREAAMQLVQRVVARAAPADYVAALRAAIAHADRLGAQLLSHQRVAGAASTTIPTCDSSAVSWQGARADAVPHRGCRYSFECLSSLSES